jgi:hypothetical protein
MKDKTPKLDPKQEKVIVALLTEPTYRQAAKKAGVGETTIYRWLQDEEFDLAYKEARNQAFNQTISRIQQSTSNAVTTLNEVMEDKESPASSRVTAAKTVLEMAIKAHEIEKVISRMDEIEKAMELKED